LPSTSIFRWASGFIFLGGLLLLWEVSARFGVTSRNLLPPISENMSVFISLVGSGVLLEEIAHSLLRVMLGLGLAILTMVPIGVAIGVSRACQETFGPFIEFLRPLPPTAVIPVAMLFLGIGDSMKVAVIGFACAFPILLNTIDGIRGVHPLLVFTARNFRLSAFEIVWRVLIPAAAPQIMVGIRISLPLSLIVVIVAEMVGSADGIGHYILVQQRSFNVREMYAGIIFVAIIGYLLNRLYILVDRWLLDWHRRSTGNR
jgi:ABC-type nitrate/sulfonate/bicarbonate transport system permease component